MCVAGWRSGWWRFALAVGLSAVGAVGGAGAQQKASGPRVVVTGEGSVSVGIKHVEKLGDVLDRLIAAGATDVWNVEFLVSDPGKALDQAREAAIADARRKAEVYARAAGITLGRVVSIEEESGASSPVS